MAEKFNCPCTRDCERRAVGCRSGCEVFQAYEAERLRGYSERYENKKNANEAYVYGVLKGRKLRKRYQ